MISKQRLEEIEKLGVGIDHNDAFGGKSKGNLHLQRSAKLAKYLAKKNRSG